MVENLYTYLWRFPRRKLKHTTTPFSQDTWNYGVTKEPKKLPILNCSIKILAPISVYTTAQINRSNVARQACSSRLVGGSFVFKGHVYIRKAKILYSFLRKLYERKGMKLETVLV